MNGWKILINIELANPEVQKFQKVDIVLGADPFFYLLKISLVKKGPNQPTQQRTFLYMYWWTSEWTIVSGKCVNNLSTLPKVNSIMLSWKRLNDKVLSLEAHRIKFTPEEKSVKNIFR